MLPGAECVPQRLSQVGLPGGDEKLRERRLRKRPTANAWRCWRRCRETRALKSRPDTFASHEYGYGKTLRFLTVIDEFTRRALWIECARHLTSVDVVRVLEQLVELHGTPATVKSDNGPEFVSKKVREWIEGRGIGIRSIEPGSPWQNGHNESFNGVFRDGCLNRWLFESV